MVPVAGVEPARYRYHWILSAYRFFDDTYLKISVVRELTEVGFP